MTFQGLCAKCWSEYQPTECEGMPKPMLAQGQISWQPTVLGTPAIEDIASEAASGSGDAVGFASRIDDLQQRGRTRKANKLSEGYE